MSREGRAPGMDVLGYKVSMLGHIHKISCRENDWA